MTVFDVKYCFTFYCSDVVAWKLVEKLLLSLSVLFISFFFSFHSVWLCIEKQILKNAYITVQFFFFSIVDVFCLHLWTCVCVCVCVLWMSNVHLLECATHPVLLILQHLADLWFQTCQFSTVLFLCLARDIWHSCCPRYPASWILGHVKSDVFFHREAGSHDRSLDVLWKPSSRADVLVLIKG